MRLLTSDLAPYEIRGTVTCIEGLASEFEFVLEPINRDYMEGNPRVAYNIPITSKLVIYGLKNSLHVQTVCPAYMAQ